MRDGVVFYKSFLDAIRNLPPDDFKKTTLAILDYGLNGIEPELDGVSEVIFVLVKPILDANNVRFENGKKGGRPKKEVEEEPKVTKHKYGENKKVLLSDEEYKKLATEYGEDKAVKAIEFLDGYIIEKGYKSKSHYLAIKRWVIEAISSKGKKKGYDWDKL